MLTRHPRLAPLTVTLLIASLLALVGPLGAARADEVVSKPSAPRGTTAAPRDSSVIVGWRPPANKGNPRLTQYVVKLATRQTGPWRVAARVHWLDRHAVAIKQLRNGRTYFVRVFARNADGLGTGTRPIKVVPRTVPGPPTAVAVAWTRARGTVDVSWGQAARHGAPIQYYVIQKSRDRRVWTQAGLAGRTARSLRVTSLPLGVTYFRVRARNAAGAGPHSSVVAKRLVNGPSAPRDVGASPDDRAATVAWLPPSSSAGLQITGYRIDRRDDTAGWKEVGFVGATVRTFANAGLVNGVAYTYRVAAVTARGAGLDSATVVTTPYGVPPKPTIDFAGWIGDQVQVMPDFTKPGMSGGYATPTVTVQRQTDEGWTNLTTDSVGLTTYSGVVGQAYTFRLIVSNPAGASLPSDPVTVTRPPDAAQPHFTNVQAGSGSVHLEWAAGTPTSTQVPATSWLVRHGQDCPYADACSTSGSYLPASTLTTDLPGLESGKEHTVWVTGCVDEVAYFMGQYVTWQRCDGWYSANAVFTP